MHRLVKIFLIFIFRACADYGIMKASCNDQLITNYGGNLGFHQCQNEDICSDLQCWRGFGNDRRTVDPILLILLLDDYKPHHACVNPKRWPYRSYLNSIGDHGWNITTLYYAGNIIQYSSVRFLRDLVCNDLLHTDVLEGMKEKNMTYGQVLALEQTIFDRFTVEKDTFYIDDMVFLPTGFFRVVPSDDIYELVDDTAVENMKTFNLAAENMLIAQRSRYVRKLMGVPLWDQLSRCQAKISNENSLPFLSFVPAREFLEWIPFNLYRNLSMTHLNLYIQKLPHNSAQSLHYMHKLQFCEDANLRKLATPPFLMSLSCELILKTPLENILFLLKAFDKLPEPYTIDYQIINCLHTLWVNFLNVTLTGNSARTELELLLSAPINVLAEAGGLVLATSWPEAIGELPVEKLTFIIETIGKQPHYRLLMVKPQNTLYSLTELGLRFSQKGKDFIPFLGSLTNYLFPRYLEVMNRDWFESALPHLNGLTRNPPVFTYPCHDVTLMSSLNQQLLAHFGPTATWTSDVIRKVRCLIYVLDDDDLDLIPSEALFQNKDLIYTCFHAARRNPEYARMMNFHDGVCQDYIGKCQAYRKQRMYNVQYRFQRAFKHYYGVPGNLSRAHDTLGHPVHCLAFQELGSARYVEQTEIYTFTAVEFDECLDWMGAMIISDETAKPLWHAIKRVYGEPKYIPRRVLLQLGSIVRGIPPDDFARLPMGDVTIIGEFGREGLWTGRDYAQLHEMANAVQYQYKWDIRSYTGWDFLLLGQITCGFPISELWRISIRSFADGLPAFASLACPPIVTRAFRDKVVHPNVLGPTRQWGPDSVRAAGTLLAGLTQADLDSIRSCAFTGVSLFAARYWPPEVFETFQKRQIMFITPEVGFNIPSRTLVQLSNETREALMNARKRVCPPDMKECAMLKCPRFKGSLTYDDAQVDDCCSSCICGARSVFTFRVWLLLLLLFLFPLLKVLALPS